MNMKKRGLGKGLSDLGLGALLGDMKAAPTAITESIVVSTPMTTATITEEPVSIDGHFKRLPLDLLQPGKYQPRKIMAPEALEELAHSIRTQGVIQPIIVRSTSKNQYEIIAGERRWRAAKLAEITHVPVIIREISDESAMVMALIENIQRRDLNVMEEAFALNRLMNEFNMTHQLVADAVGKSRTAVTNILRLLKLNMHVRGLIESAQLEMGHARALLSLDEDQQTDAANWVVSRKLSVRETESYVQKILSGDALNFNEPAQKTISAELQERLTKQLGVKVSVMQNDKGRGKLVLRYRNEKELDHILQKLQ